MDKENRLKQVLSIQSSTYAQFRTFAYIIRFAKANNIAYKVEEGNIYLTKGNVDIYPCVVAHMDTVHSMQSDFEVKQAGQNLYAFNNKTVQQVGIGGDDKVGIYIALECLLHFDNIKAVFFRDEETGCEGSAEANMNFFDDCSIVLQADRKGNSDFVSRACNVDLHSKATRKKLKHIVEKHGYNFCFNGGLTDVYELKTQGLNVAVANVSCGYYRPHTSEEYVNIPDVLNCLSLFKAVINEVGNEKQLHKYVNELPIYNRQSKHSSYNSYSAFDDFDWSGYDYSGRSRKKETFQNTCWDCQTPIDTGKDLCQKCADYYEKNYGMINIYRS